MRSALETKLLAFPQLGGRHAGIDLPQRYDAEGDMPGLVRHDVARDLLQQRILCQLVLKAEGRQSQSFDHNLHAEESEIPAGILDNVIEETPQVHVDGKLPLQFLAQVLGVNLHVPGFIQNLR